MNQIPEYDRQCKLTLEQGLAIICAGLPTVTVAGVTASARSLRLQTFLRKGLKCSFPGCELEGSFFAVERLHMEKGKRKKQNPYNKFHINLWGKRPNGKEVLFTHDHVISRGLGGKDAICNTVTMCCWHNWEKARFESQVHNLLELARKSSDLIYIKPDPPPPTELSHAHALQAHLRTRLHTPDRVQLYHALEAYIAAEKLRISEKTDQLTSIAICKEACA